MARTGGNEMEEREMVQEMVGLWAIDLSSCGVQLPVSDVQELGSKIMQLLTTMRQETYREILEDGLNDTFTHPEWVAFLERGAGVHGENREQKT